jgi:hypothetical protein
MCAGTRTTPAFMPAISWQPIPPNLGMLPELRGWHVTWPRRDFVELAATKAAVSGARDRLRLLLQEWGVTEVIDEAAVVVSEMVANAGAPRGALSYPRFSRDELKGGSWA